MGVITMLRFTLIISICIGVFITPVRAQSPLTLSEFTDCIGADGAIHGYGDTCWLGINAASGSNGVWDVSNTLAIGRSVEIIGTAGDSTDVILRRTTSLGSMPIMFGNGGITVTIHWLTFDGNRQNTTPCATSNPTGVDLNLSSVGNVTVQDVSFIDAPWDSLYLGGNASTVSYSNFGQGFVRPDRGYSRTGPQTAARWNSVFLLSDNSGAWVNNIANSGVTAVTVYSGTTEYVVGNIVLRNRYEQPDGVSGGQIYVIYGGPTYASIANNLINGDYWHTTGKDPSNTDILCYPGGSGLYPFGVEGFGIGHHYFNNSIIQNLGYGMLLRASDTSGGTLDSNTISGYDPFCTEGCTYVPHYIDSNAGCWEINQCFGVGYPASMGVAGLNINNSGGTASNITLDHVRVSNSGRFGVSIYNVSGGPGFTDSQNGGFNYACIYNNTGGDLITSGSAAGYMSFTNSCP